MSTKLTTAKLTPLKFHPSRFSLMGPIQDTSDQLYNDIDAYNGNTLKVDRPKTIVEGLPILVMQDGVKDHYLICYDAEVYAYSLFAYNKGIQVTLKCIVIEPGSIDCQAAQQSRLLLSRNNYKLTTANGLNDKVLLTNIEEIAHNRNPANDNDLPATEKSETEKASEFATEIEDITTSFAEFERSKFKEDSNNNDKGENILKRCSENSSPRQGPSNESNDNELPLFYPLNKNLEG